MAQNDDAPCSDNEMTSIMSDSVDIDSALAPLTLTHFLKHNYAYIKILFVNAYPIQLKSWSMKDLVDNLLSSSVVRDIKIYHHLDQSSLPKCPLRTL